MQMDVSLYDVTTIAYAISDDTSIHVYDINTIGVSKIDLHYRYRYIHYRHHALMDLSGITEFPGLMASENLIC
jgi:hypothetical protein